MTEHLTDVVSDVGGAAPNRDARPLAGRRVTCRLRKGPALPWSQTMRRLVRTLGLLVPVVLVAGALTGCDLTPGGTAWVTTEYSDYAALSTLHFDAVSGRNNNITVQGSSGYPSSLLLRDTRNSVAAGAGCTRVDLNTVRCDITTPPSAGFFFQEIGLGDGDDTFASSVGLYSTRVHAGAGNDTVNGGPGDDEFYEDADALDRDSFSGGYGHDQIHYEGVLHAVNISLNDVADDGRPGEGDNVKSDVEDISGTANADTLTGDGDSNAIFAHAGNDTVEGYAGQDFLFGEAGDDYLRGGAGPDSLDGGTETDYCDVGQDGGWTVDCETGP